MEKAERKPKLILTDLDGTLLRGDKSLSVRNRAALERAAVRGAELVVATGRFYGGVPRELLDLPFLRYFILMNGAKVYDRKEDKVLYKMEIDLAVAEGVFDLMEPLDATVDCYQNDRGLMARRYYDRLDYYITDPISRQLTRHSRVPVDDFRGAVRAGGNTVQKIQCFFPHLELRPQAMARLAQSFPQLVQSISIPGNLELNQKGATKGDALLALCRTLGLDPAETAAFGDGTNDLTMLKNAGVGVAMANAAPPVLAAADRMTASNEEDGVARVLEEWSGY